MLLDREDLTLKQAYVNGTTNDDQEATVVAVTSDGDFIVAGYTWGEYFSANAGADNSESERPWVSVRSGAWAHAGCPFFLSGPVLNAW